MDLDNVPEHARPGLLAMNATARLPEEQKKLAADAIDLMREGMLLGQIAERLGCSTGRVSQLVMDFYPEEWKKAKTAANMIRYEKAQQEFDNDGTDPEKGSLDGLKLAYARERAKFAHIMLQATRRDMFDLSDKTAVNINAAGQVAIQVVSYSETTAPQQIAQKTGSSE